MKKISAKTMRQIADIPAVEILLENGEVSTTLEIKRYISLEDIYHFINEVVENSFDDNDEYSCLRREVSFAYAALKYYTNANTEAGLETLFDFWCANNIREKIEEVSSSPFSLWNLEAFILEAIDKRIPKKKKGLDALCEKILYLFEEQPTDEKTPVDDMSPEDMLSLIENIKEADWGAVVQEVLNQDKFKKEESES